MFLNGNIYHICQNRKQNFSQIPFFRKESVFLSLLCSRRTKLFRKTVCLERASSNSSFPIRATQKLGGKIKDIPEGMTLEDKHGRSLLVGF